MKELNKKALTYSALGMTAVILVAFLTNLLAPQNQLGQGLRFTLPLLTGILSGGAIFFKLKNEADIDFDQINQDQ